MKVYVCILAIVSTSLAEPPVPSSGYLPSQPSPNYGPPNGGGGGKPGTQYGPPTPNSQYGPPGGNIGGGGGGGDGGYDDQSEPANYQFKYDVQDAESGNDFGHEEQRNGDDTRGKYYVLLPDGRRQIVEYTADSEGYKPRISYEQAGGGGGGGYPGSGGGYPGGGPGGPGGYQY